MIPSNKKQSFSNTTTKNSSIVNKRKRPKSFKDSTRVPKSTKRYVNQVINKSIETKYYDGSVVSQGVDWSGSIIGPITDIPQGDTDSNRIGDKVKLYGLNMKYTVQWSDSINLLRVIVFQWIPSSLVNAPSVGDILPSSGLGNTFSPLLNYVWDDQSQRIILYDKIHKMVASQDSGYQVDVEQIPLTFAKKRINFIAGSNEGYHHIYILVISDSGAAGHPNFVMTRRFTFKDA